MGDAYGGDDNLLWAAVADAIAPVAHLEKDWDNNKLEKKLREYFKKAAKDLEFDQKPWQELVNDYADNVFSSLCSALGDREWMRQGQADFIFCMDAGVKDNFPRTLIQNLIQEDFEQVVLAAHDRACEEQRILPLVWEAVQRHIHAPKVRNKVYNAIDAGRKQAVLTARSLEDVVSIWIDTAVRQLGQENHGSPSYAMDSSTACDLFHALLDAECLPRLLLQVTGPPPPRWRHVDEETRTAYAKYTTNSGGGGDKDRRKGGGKGFKGKEKGKPDAAVAPQTKGNDGKGYDGKGWMAEKGAPEKRNPDEPPPNPHLKALQEIASAQSKHLAAANSNPLAGAFAAAQLAGAQAGAFALPQLGIAMPQIAGGGGFTFPPLPVGGAGTAAGLPDPKRFKSTFHAP
jgi:hypothetical protein